MPNEHAKADVKIDNSHCKIAVKAVSLNCEQEIKLNCQGHSFSDKINLVDQKANGVPPKHDNKEDRSLNVDL